MLGHRAPHLLQCCLTYIRDIMQTTLTQYGYADDLTLLSAHKTWKVVELTLNRYMQSSSNYLKQWQLKLSTTKTTTTAFNLNNRSSLTACSLCEWCPPQLNIDHPVWLGVALDCSLTYKNHIERLCQKIYTRNRLLRCLAGSCCGEYTKLYEQVRLPSSLVSQSMHH